MLESCYNLYYINLHGECVITLFFFLLFNEYNVAVGCELSQWKKNHRSSNDTCTSVES